MSDIVLTDEVNFDPHMYKGWKLLLSSEMYHLDTFKPDQMKSAGGYGEKCYWCWLCIGHFKYQ
eukprot:10437489-Ditylum_brightwellii.AAC.1